MIDTVTHTATAPTTSALNNAATLFAGPGDMRAACRTHNWAASAIGPVPEWPVSLRVAVQHVLALGTPALLHWGPACVQVFNDAFRPSLGTGDDHRTALGAAAADYWGEAWPVRAADIGQVLAGGPPVLHTDVRHTIVRDGRAQDTWWTYTDTPVFSDDGAIAGVLVLCQETTARVLSDRRHAASEIATEHADRRAARILDQVADQHLTMDAEFRIRTMNAAAERGFGVPQSDMIGRTHWEAFPASVGSLAEEQYRRAMRERVPVHFAHHYVGDGYDVHLEIDVYPTDDGGLAVFWRDVTSRVNAERAILDVTERYRVLFESVDTGFAIIEIMIDAAGHATDYRFLEVNAAFVEHTGLTDAVGRTVRELVPGLESVWVETFARVAETGEALHFEQSSEAMGRWFDVSAVRVGQAADRRVALLFRDVSAQRAAVAEREALLQALVFERERLREVFRQTPAFLALLDGPQHVFEFANDAYHQLVGHRDMIGKPAFEVFPDARDQGFEALLDGVLQTGVPFIGRDVPFRLVRTPGAAPAESFVDLTFTPMLGADGIPTGVIMHGVDRTVQVRAREQVAAAETQLQAFADAMPTLAFTARADGYLDWYNAQWYTYTGMTPSEMEGWGWQSVQDPAVLPAVSERWQTSIATGAPFEMTFPLRGADGTFQSFLTRVVPAHDASGTVTRWLGTSTNIEFEQRLRNAAEVANRAKSEFLAIMSHELRTPLNAIDGYAELMELGIRGPVTEEQRHDLGRIRRSEQHLLGLINGVLNYAQVEAGAVQYDVALIPLEEVLSVCEALTAPQVQRKLLTLHRETCEASLIVRTDREKLQQIILNLLSNALKFTDSGGRIDVHCVQRTTQFAPTVDVTVTDTGIGIPATHLARIFEPFVQVDSELTRKREGTGLGLAISRDLARAMGGDLTAVSTLGHGSTFTLSLPACVPSPA